MDLENTVAATGGAIGANRGGDEPAELPRGTAVGRYLLLGRLGAGAMGVVYAAHDPELDRKVALKLLAPRTDGSAGSEGRARLLREAQALAMLAHPNVVAVHDAGTHDDSVWIAMEFVAGQTLSAWVKQQPRRWPEVLKVLTDAARGVAAAHAAGLVHRDLKPDNVMVDPDGRVRVMDFGLAHGRGPGENTTTPTSTPPVEAKARPELSALTMKLTAVGSIQGTPAYMAPEQWEGHEAQATTDQFGWSAMAWELLYGERPFAGETVLAIAERVLAGQRHPPPAGRRVPGWLRRVIERGLAREPSRRWPSMAALLAALERGRTRARVRTAGLVLAAITLLGIGAEGYRRWRVAQQVAVCDARGADIDRVWNDEARKQLNAAFVATGVSFAQTTANKVMPWLDEQARTWKQARTDVCQNHAVRAVWDQDILDRAVWCLEDREMDLESLVAEFARANTTTVQKAVSAAASLRTIDACTDADLLRRQPAPPTQGLEAIRGVRATLSRAQSLGLAGTYKEALPMAMEARERAQKIEWPPLMAAARVLEGALLEKTGAYEEAEAASTAAYFAAARSGAWEMAAAAATDLIQTVGYRRVRPAEGHMWAQHAEMAIGHAGDRVGLSEAKRLNNLANVQYLAGKYPEARSLHERALAIREQALGPGHPHVAGSLINLANVHMLLGSYAEALALHLRALAIYKDALGPGHPEVAGSLNNLGALLHANGAYAEARAFHEQALAIYEESLGPQHPSVASCLNNLANVYMSTGDLQQARALHERVLAIREQTLGAHHPDVATSLNNLGFVLHTTGAYAEARALHERALAIREQALGPRHPEVATSLSNLALGYQATGAYAEARALHERALTIREQTLGPDHPYVAMSLNYLAELDLAQGAPAAALGLLERSVAILTTRAGVQEMEFESQFNLARAIVETHGDPARALALARAARDGLRTIGAGKTKQLAAVEQWLTEHTDAP